LQRVAGDLPKRDMPEKPYRPCVAIVLFNRDGKVLVAERNDVEAASWQLPQGGIDPEENPAEAALRELEEEIGTAAATVIAEALDWTDYDWPADIDRTPGKGRFRGQRVKPVALNFAGSDDDIDLATAHPEFRAWKWIDIEEIPRLIVSFKKPLYVAIVAAFLKTRDGIRDS
jgi:putative (di)nucleoside polyphosphate hydrolase